MFRTFAIFLPLALSAGLASAQETDPAATGLPEACKTAAGGMDHGMMAQPMQMPEGASASAMGYGKAMENMHGPMMTAMMIPDPDMAFACGMIPHHQGAIDMAQTVQENGQDQEIKAMAQEMIDAQMKEIEELTTWIEAHAAQ